MAGTKASTTSASSSSSSKSQLQSTSMHTIDNLNNSNVNATSFKLLPSTMTVTKLAVGLVVLLSLLEVTNAQNIHFSNGWYPGKKRSSPSSSSLHDAVAAAAAAPLMSGMSSSTSSSSSSGVPTGFSACSVRPDIGELINKIIMEEIVRLHSTCLFGVTRDLRELLETAAGKQNKW